MELKGRSYNVIPTKGTIVEWRYFGPPPFWRILKTMLRFWMRYSTAKKHIISVIVERN